jgi:integrase
MSIKKVKIANDIIRWEVIVRPVGQGRKQIKRRFERKIEAEDFLKQLEKRENEALIIPGTQSAVDIEATTFDQEADFWFESKFHSFTKGYLRVIKPGLKRIRRIYGNFKIARFTPSLLNDFRSSMRKEGLSPSTQNRYVDLIARIISFSFNQKRINFNPTIGFEKLRENKEEMKFWSEEEVYRFLNYANNRYSRTSPKRWIYCVYLLALETGLRAREIWGLKVKDISEFGNKLLVSRQSISANVFERTKGKDSRFVPFSPELRNEIEKLISNSGINDPERTIFASCVNTAIDHDNFSERVFYPDLIYSKLPQIRFHDLRHTAFTLMVKRGILLPVIQKIAGHKDIKTTMRYVHVVGKDIEDIGSRISLTPDEIVKKRLSIV